MRRTERLLAGCAHLLAAMFVAGTGLADPPRESGQSGPRIDDISSYSPYEQETVSIGLKKVGASLDPEPEGKVIEGVDIVTLEVFELRDPIPTRLNGFVNFFHVTSKPHFIERELLFKRGDRYERGIIEESARNLRGLPQLSVVLLLPTRGSAPDRIRMLVVTKDLWSLRVPVEYRITSSGAFEFIEAQVTEINMLGTHHQISANFSYDPFTVSFGGSLIVPRVWDSRFRFVADMNPIINHQTGEIEGASGSVSYSMPLFSIATPWSYGARLAWETGVVRLPVSSRLTVFDPTEDGCIDPQAVTDGVARIPCQYTQDAEAGRIFVTRSLGREIKHNFTFAAEASRAVYRTAELSAYDPAVAARFRERIPRLSDTRLGVEVGYQTLTTDYARVLDFERLGLQEEFQLGHNLILKASPAYAPLRDSRFVLGLFAGASYTVPLGDGIARAFVESQTDFEPDRVPDASLDMGGRLMSPRTGAGRLLFDARFLYRFENYLNRSTSLGGASRLRGYPSSKFRGKDTLSFNLEFRSRPVEILKAQVGGALFYDAGDAFDGIRDLRMKQSAGFGLRVFLPQINRIVIRGDWGFPLTPGYRYGDVSADTGRVIGGFPGELTVTFGQAFPMPVVPIANATTQQSSL